MELGYFFLGSLKESEIILGSQENFGVPLGKNLEDLKKTNPYFYFFSALLFFLFFSCNFFVFLFFFFLCFFAIPREF